MKQDANGKVAPNNDIWTEQDSTEQGLPDRTFEVTGLADDTSKR